MCRIAGLVTNRLQAEQAKATVGIICDALQHGGPDDAGVYCSEDARVTFGNRRLAIIDLSRAGHQPMADNSRKAWITFNGEIYNYRELKADLQKLGAVFTTGTDTEVIIQAYLYWGTGSFSKLRGMFAFALYDVAGGDVYLVRDTTGIKPLYYYAEDGRIAFASEIRALKAAGIATASDNRWPVWLLAFGHIPEPYTTLKNVLSLPPGHFLCCDKRGRHTLTSYQQTARGNYITDAQTAREGISRHLTKAVKRQLIADAPIGVFLSGGIDSSLLTLLANHERGQLKTVSIYFNEADYDERKYQNAVLDKISGDNFTHLVKQADFEANLPCILNAMDMPTTDGINSWFISKYAHEDGLKTVLSGIGADELFGGYPSFNRMAYLRYLKMLPPSVFRTSAKLNKDNYRKLAYLAFNNPVADYLFLRGLFAPLDIAKLTGMHEAGVNSILFNTLKLPELETHHKLQAAWFETNLYMQNQLLHDTDVMSMCHGLEVRVPYLNEDLQQHVSQIKPSVRFQKHPAKKILIDSFGGLIPKMIWDRPKMGFTFPLQQWMKDTAQINDISIYKGEAAKSVIHKFGRGQMHWSRAYALYQVQGHV
ncbi:asparagine synthase (glutamine-hydrolyzing) [Mucilaginibacter sp. 14171R-50]|uniref:asparagine synthase (glutamine-hydrolyzing) n=1 Tax=Mucilaginibacter sp. 14171R-50 TaxID=2703789 RepID=UPI00138B9D3C|nr:asparagine synthase (glutamine-hydrolyzing) [Mucilaginibacter sp. 14171R-50]QHS56353.1 asparagine synthase (glutamine-hydrolyzing) [Mucilaginibacter sp. 14171R-50]